MARKSDHQMEVDAKNLLLEKGYQLIPFGYFKCNITGRILSVKQNNFYITDNILYKHCIAKTDEGEVSLLPYSKKAIEEMFKEFRVKTKDNEKLAMYKLTQELRIPWIETIWQMAEESESQSYKIYIGKFNSLKQYAGLTMADSEDYIGDSDATFSDENNMMSEISMKKREKKDAVKRWGNSWNEYQLIRLEELYHNMKASNRIETPQDEDYVKKLVRLSVKVDEAIENDESGKAKQLGDLYSKYMSDAKFRAQDMTDADKQGGLRTFSQIYAEVESEDFIPPWEKYTKFLNVGQDIVDRTIMHLENFTLRFNNAERMARPPEDTPKVGE